MSMYKIKTYLKGFFKGLGLLLIVFVMGAILEILHKPNVSQEILQQFLEGIFFIAFTAYFVRKHNQSETWILCSLFSLPFLFGAIEYQKHFSETHLEGEKQKK